MHLFGPPNVSGLKRTRDVRGLIKALGYVPDASVRRAAATALGDLGDVRAVDRLVVALKDGDPSVRQSSAAALGKIGDPRAVEPLTCILTDPASWALKPLAAASLGQIGDSLAIPGLVASLRDGDTSTTRAAADALGRLGWQPDRSAAGAAYSAAKGRWDDCVDLGDLAVEPLVAILADSSERGSEAGVLAAGETLGRIGGEQATEALVDAMRSYFTDVRRAAAIGFGRLGGERAVELLVIALDDGAMDVRRAATDALGEIGDPRALEALIPHLGRHYAGVSSGAAVVKIGTPAVGPLIAVLGDARRDAQVRLGAADVLGCLGDPRAVEPLIAALEDLAGFGPAVIISALGRLGDRRAVEPLILVLGDERGGVRRAAAGALGAIGDRRALAALRAAHDDPDPSVREEAAEAVARITEGRPVGAA